MTMEAPLKQTDLLGAMSRTDYVIATKWIWAPVASYAIWTMIAVIRYVYRGDAGIPLGTIFGGLDLAGFVFSAPFSYLVYKLVNRRNQHFAREEDLLWSTVESTKAKVQQSDMRSQIALASAERDLARLADNGKEHSAVLWALLTLIPYAGWIFLTYVLSFLLSDVRKHELQEDLVLEDLGGIMKAQRGVDLPIRLRRVPNRPVILYAALSLVGPGVLLSLWLSLTFEMSIGSPNPSVASPESIVLLASGLFLLAIVQLFWLFQAMKDPDSHFEHHRSFERILLPETMPAVSPGMTS